MPLFCYQSSTHYSALFNKGFVAPSEVSTRLRHFTPDYLTPITELKIAEASRTIAPGLVDLF